MNARTKFEVRTVALPVPEIIGDTQKIWAVPGYAQAPLSPTFEGAFVRMNSVNMLAKFEVRSFTRSCGDNNDWNFGPVLRASSCIRSQFT